MIAGHDSFSSYRWSLVRRWLCGKAVSGSNKILYGVLVKEIAGEHRQVRWPPRYNESNLQRITADLQPIFND